MTAKENLAHDYGRLAGFLRGISLRFQLLATLEFLLLLPSGFLLVLLGSTFILDLKKAFPYLPFVYAWVSIVFLFVLLVLAIWRIGSRPSMERVARRVEETFPHLKDDVTNSFLLFEEVEKESMAGRIPEGRISERLIVAQIRRTVAAVSSIRPGQVVSFKGALRYLRLFLPLLFAFSIVFALDPQILGRSMALILHPFSNLPVRDLFISLDPKGSTVLRGAPLVIRAQTTGHLPDKLTLTIWPLKGEPRGFAMEPEGDGNFSYRVASVGSSFRYQANHGSVHSPLYTLQAVDPPEIGKMRLTLIPPDYTGLPAVVKEEGHVEALKGTVVNLEARVTKAIKEGKMILDQENQLLLKVKEDQLTGSLLVLSPGTYHIEVKDDLGFENPNPVRYQIRLIPDQYPEAEIVSPGHDLEISGGETLPIVYTGKDDFGITSIRLIYQTRGKDGAINLRSGDTRLSVGPETFKWDLGSLGLAPGDRVVYRVEIWDNDSISGPKKGSSQAFVLSVRDDRAQAAKEGEEAHEIADALLDLLADQLEDLKEKEGLVKGMEEVLKQVERNLERMKERPDRFELEALKRNLLSLKNRALDEPKETVTQELERLALLAEDIAKRARMNEVEALAKELRNRQRRLLDFMNDLKGPLNKENLEAVMKELKKLEELLRSVMDALSKMATRLPDEFVNSQELSGLEFQDLFKDLDEIQKKLMAGDLAGALEAAQRLLQALSEMVANLSSAGARAGMAPFDRLQGEMSRQSGELDKILTEQKEILKETERIDREVRRKREEETERRLGQSLPDLEELLRQLFQSLPPDLNELLEEWKALLKKDQLERFSEMAKKMEKDLSEGPEERDLIRRLREKVERLTPDEKEIMLSEDKEKFPGLSSRQGNLKERTTRLKERLEMLAQLFPGMDTEILNDMKEAAGSMEKASGKLKGEDAPGAIPPEQEAIMRLGKSQQAMQQMAQQMAMQMQAARWGYPYAYDPRAGWYYGPWAPMPTLPQPEFQRPRERGYTGIDREEFEPPSKDAYQVPKMFREKVVESLKEEVPSQYKKGVEQYFRELTK